LVTSARIEADAALRLNCTKVSVDASVFDTIVQWASQPRSDAMATRFTTSEGPAMSTSKDAQRATIHQSFGSLQAVRIGLSTEIRHNSVRALNRLLAHSMALRDLYKKAHWQTSGAAFYGLHLMFDKHYEQQLELVDTLAERVQLLGGVALATANDVVQESRIARTAPSGAEAPAQQLRGLLDAHEFLLNEARPLARAATEYGDDGTNDLIVGGVIRTNELQAWFVGEHLAGDTPQE
jgi:starvation-inducible DNA-binding protein